MVCFLSISQTPSLLASCNAPDRSLSMPTQNRDAQEIKDIDSPSFTVHEKFSFPTSSTVRQGLCVRFGCSISAGFVLSPWVVQDGTSFRDRRISLPLSWLALYSIAPLLKKINAETVTEQIILVTSTIQNKFYSYKAEVCISSLILILLLAYGK